jgi:2-polyprenyl-3-methyl-5-hydroxy-6-metoxy-1,4-benzoquinol methylase
MIIKTVIRFTLSALRRSVRYLSNLEKKFDQEGTLASKQERNVIRSTRAHDMYGDVDEQYYRKQYWFLIKDALDKESLATHGVGLDLGCGQGRLTTLLAKYLSNGHVTAVDISPSAIGQAKNYSANEQVNNILFTVGDILATLKSFDNEAFDVVMMTEVTFFYPEWEKALDEIQRVLKPKGVLCIAVRPLYYNALALIGLGMSERADMLLEKRIGNVFGGDTCLTWQKSKEMVALLQGKYGLEVLNVTGIGCCSGIEGDPHALIARPSMLSSDQAEELMRLELEIGRDIPDAGRYMLLIARKN